MCSPASVSTANVRSLSSRPIGGRRAHGVEPLLLGEAAHGPVADQGPGRDLGIVEPGHRVVQVARLVEGHQPHLFAFPSVGHAEILRLECRSNDRAASARPLDPAAPPRRRARHPLLPADRLRPRAGLRPLLRRGAARGRPPGRLPRSQRDPEPARRGDPLGRLHPDLLAHAAGGAARRRPAASPARSSGCSWPRPAAFSLLGVLLARPIVAVLAAGLRPRRPDRSTASSSPWRRCASSSP